MKTSPCFGQISYTADIEKIEGLDEDMKKLWIQTKAKQLELKYPQTPIDAGKMPVAPLDMMNRIEEKLAPYSEIYCSISGGSDSDMMLDMLSRSTKRFKEIRFVFFDTGIEYQATKDHLDMLEQKYGVEIYREKAVKSIPHCVKTYGQPFMSKRISELMFRLQKHDFQWEDGSFEELLAKYPKCRSALRWWCNQFGPNSPMNISRNKGLKEFIMANPPQFKIANKCCEFAKKQVAYRFEKDHNCDLAIYGVRKAEHGARAIAYNSCMSDAGSSIAQFRPLFWIKDADKKGYAEACGVTNSLCYTEYGLKRTGCACCPFGKEFEMELEVARIHEPKLYKAVNNVFADSYDYTRRYLEFRKQNF